MSERREVDERSAVLHDEADGKGDDFLFACVYSLFHCQYIFNKVRLINFCRITFDILRHVCDKVVAMLWTLLLSTSKQLSGYVC